MPDTDAPAQRTIALWKDVAHEEPLALEEHRRRSGHHAGGVLAAVHGAP